MGALRSAMDSAWFKLSFFGGPSVTFGGAVAGLTVRLVLEGVALVELWTSELGEDFGVAVPCAQRQLGATNTVTSDCHNTFTRRFALVTFNSVNLYPAPGGELLWTVERRADLFGAQRRPWPDRLVSRRLPEITQRVNSPNIGTRFGQDALAAAAPGAVLGSRLLTTGHPRQAQRSNNARSKKHRRKRLPSSRRLLTRS
jgi:hypothetical protein